MRVRVCVPAQGSGGHHFTHRGVLALPARPPHLPGSRAGLLPLLLGTSLLLLLSLLWAQTQPVKPELDPRSPPQRPTHRAATLPGWCHAGTLVGMVFTCLLPGRAEPLPRADFHISSGGGDLWAAPLPRLHTALPRVDTFSEPHTHHTGSDKKVVSGYEFIYMGKKI